MGAAGHPLIEVTVSPAGRFARANVRTTPAEDETVPEAVRRAGALASALLDEAIGLDGAEDRDRIAEAQYRALDTVPAPEGAATDLGLLIL